MCPGRICCVKRDRPAVCFTRRASPHVDGWSKDDVRTVYLLQRYYSLSHTHARAVHLSRNLTIICRVLSAPKQGGGGRRSVGNICMFFVSNRCRHIRHGKSDPCRQSCIPVVPMLIWTSAPPLSPDVNPTHTIDDKALEPPGQSALPTRKQTGSKLICGWQTLQPSWYHRRAVHRIATGSGGAEAETARAAARSLCVIWVCGHDELSLSCVGNASCRSQAV